MLSIIIPTLNEEKFLPLLLESIKKQDFKDYEIIIADNNSKDRTVEIAKAYGCKVVPGGFPPKARNEGAKVAKGEILLFLDSDVILPEKSLLKFTEEFKTRNLDIATSLLQPLSPSRVLKLGFDLGYNLPIIFLEKILPHGCDFMMAKKELHEKIGGFDEEVVLLEDVVYMRAGAKIGKFGVLRSAKVLTSPRRLEQDGWIRTGLKDLLAEVYVTFVGPIKKDIFLYHFNPYQEEKRIFKNPYSTLINFKLPLRIFYWLSGIILVMIWVAAFLYFIFYILIKTILKIFRFF